MFITNKKQNQEIIKSKKFYWNMGLMSERLKIVDFLKNNIGKGIITIPDIRPFVFSIKDLIVETYRKDEGTLSLYSTCFKNKEELERQCKDWNITIDYPLLN